MTGKIQGVVAAVPTPFTADARELDLPQIKKLVDRLVDNGVHGLVTTGTTGEFPTLTTEEHKSVIKAYVEAANKRLTVIAGIGSNSTEHGIEMVKYSEKVGADACMIVPPFYDPLPFKALYQYYEDVCSATSLSVMYYNLPAATGVHLTADQVRQLSEIKGFDYMKDTSGNAKEFADLLTNPTDKISVFNGWDTLTFFAMTHGAKAVVWGVASICPKKCVELWNTVTVEKDLDKAREQWKFLWEVSDFLEAGVYPAGIKGGLDIIGQSMGPLRKPTLPLDKEETEKFTKILSKRKY